MGIRHLCLVVALVVPVLHGQGIITTVAGNGTAGFTGDGGPATSAEIGGYAQPLGMAVDNQGNVYVMDGGSNRIRKVDEHGIINTVAGGGNGPGLGDGGPAINAQIGPQGIVFDSAGNMYIAGGNLVRKVNPAGIISTIAGNVLAGPFFSGDGGPAVSAGLSASNVAVDGAGNVYISDIINNRIRKIDKNGIITTVAGSGAQGYSGDGGPATKAALFLPQGLAADKAGNLYFADNAVHVRKVDTSGIITTIAGDGTPISISEGVLATKTGMTPTFVAVDGAGNLFIADTGGGRVRKIDASGIINTVAGKIAPSLDLGDGGPATNAYLTNPTGVAVDNAGNLYIADTNHFRIRKVTGVAAVVAAAPSIAANGVVNGASFQPGITAGSWGTIQGSNLSSKTDTWANSIIDGKLPTTLDGVTVTIGGKAAYLYYVSRGQINFVVPDVSAGAVPVVVKTGGGSSATFTVTASSFGPAFFAWPNHQVVATRQDFSWAVKNGTFTGATTVAAKPGDTIILWGTGFGTTAPVAPVGMVTPSDTTYSTSTLPAITIDNNPVTVYGAALAPGFAGLYQIAIQVPAQLADGDHPIQASIGGIQSPSGSVLSVKN